VSGAPPPTRSETGPANVVLGGRYRLLDQIGTGALAPVWRAHDEVLDRTVAIKILTHEDSSDVDDFARAQNEARCAARLAHPNVAGVYDFGTSRRGSRGAAYVVMELVEGPLLSEYLRGGPLGWRFATRICAEVCAGLAAAHAYGIVHRDLKPGNVVLAQTGAKILDFGIAARAGEADWDEDGTVAGTKAYMAPERQTGAPVAAALDLYSVGVVLYRSLTSRLPWDAADDEEMWHTHRSVPPTPLPRSPGWRPRSPRSAWPAWTSDPRRARRPWRPP
jgi:serine/threonine protein kinase